MAVSYESTTKMYESTFVLSYFRTYTNFIIHIKAIHNNVRRYNVLHVGPREKLPSK